MNNGTFLDILVRGIMNLIQPGASALTSLAKTAGDSYLNSPNNASGYLPGDIATLGDAYTVDTREFAKNAYTVLNVYQDVIFTLSPDIAPSVGIGSGVGRVDISVPNTTPSPSANFDTSLVFSAPSWMTTKKLPKGFKYKITNGMITPPNGYQPSGQPFEFFVPGSSTVSVPCVLTVILKLKITSDVPCTVTVKRNGMTFSQGTTISVNNENVYIIDKIQPATYEISGIGITLPPGHSPKMGSDSKTITPIPAVEVDVALKLIKTP